MLKVSEPLRQQCVMLLASLLIGFGTHRLYVTLHPDQLSYKEAKKYSAKNNWKKAAFFYEKSLQQGINKPHLLVELSNAYAKLGEFPKAIKAYELYLQFHPREAWALKTYAELLTANGDFNKAAKIYEKILQNTSKPHQMDPKTK